MEQKLQARSRIQVEPVHNAVPPPPPPPPPPQPAQPVSNPRSGKYNDEDVSIEKFFYMGSK